MQSPNLLHKATDGYKSLNAAVVHQAVDDVRIMLKEKSWKRESGRAQRVKDFLSAVAFFRSEEFCDQICGAVGIDGDAVRQRMEKDIRAAEELGVEFRVLKSYSEPDDDLRFR